MSWFVYLVRCADHSLYTGVAKDVDRRVDEHNHSPKGAKYTRARRPVTLVYQEPCTSRQAACQREWQVKRLTRQAKLALIAKQPAAAHKFDSETTQTPGPAAHAKTTDDDGAA